MKDEAGTAAAIARPNVTPQTEMKDEAGTAAAIARPNVTPQAQMKDEAGTAAAIGQSSGGTELLGSKASQDGTSQGR
jgi:hypothetical protein